MSFSHYTVILVILAIVAANLPWLSNKLFMVFRVPGKSGKAEKSFRWCLLEWLSLYALIAFLAIGMERKITGVVQGQGWEFYVVTITLFAVFALPGFIYKYDLKRILQKKSKTPPRQG